MIQNNYGAMELLFVSLTSFEPGFCVSKFSSISVITFIQQVRHSKLPLLISPMVSFRLSPL